MYRTFFADVSHKFETIINMRGSKPVRFSKPHRLARIMMFFITLLCIQIISASEENGEGGLERVLGDASIGASFAAFVEAHPEAVYSDEEKRKEPVKKDAPGSLLIVHTEDPFLGLYNFANFGFKEEKLYELVAVWSGNPDAVRDHRRRFFTAAIKRHGHAYVRKSMVVFPNTTEQRIVAVFYWQEPDKTILTFYTPPSPLDVNPRATLSYAQFKPDSPFLTDIFINAATTPEQHEQAWKDLSDIMEFLD
jgi:hypothetical protein